MKEHTCLQCGINGYSPDGDVPYEWVDRSFTVHAPLQDPKQKRVVVCSPECFSDAVNEHESRGAEVVL